MKKKRRNIPRPSSSAPTYLFVVLIALAGFAIVTGLNGSDTQEKATGTIELALYEKDSSIILDSHRAGTTKLPHETITLDNLSVGQHRVLVSKFGYWPWGKLIEVADGKTSSFTPLILKKILESEDVPEYLPLESDSVLNPRYSELYSAIENAPQESTSYDTRVDLTSSETNIIATWTGTEDYIPDYFCIADICYMEYEILQTPQSITHAEFFPLSKEHVIFASKNSIFMIELDQNGTQNIQPVFIGVEPHFTIIESIVYVLDNGIITAIHLD